MELATLLKHPVDFDGIPSVRRLSVDDYHVLARAGVFRPDERVELIEGEIRCMNPKGPMHSAGATKASNALRTHLGDRGMIRLQDPIGLSDDSEPEPDLVLVVPKESFYADHHPRPEEVLLVIEISDTSLLYDRNVKGRLFAKAGIRQYCILNLITLELEDYREPDENGYRLKNTYKSNQCFNLVAFPENLIPVGDLFPPR